MDPRAHTRKTIFEGPVCERPLVAYSLYNYIRGKDCVKKRPLDPELKFVKYSTYTNLTAVRKRVFLSYSTHVSVSVLRNHGNYILFRRQQKFYQPGRDFATFMVHLQLSLLTSGNGSTMVLCSMLIMSVRYGAKCFPHTSTVRVNISTANSRSSSAVSRVSFSPSL